MPALGDVIASNIRAERSRRRWRQRDLADLLGWSHATVSAIEIGKRQVGAGELADICRALGVTFADLVRGADPDDLRALGF